MTSHFRCTFRRWIFGGDKDQAVRIERLLLASSTYLFGIFIVGYCRWHGLFPAAPYTIVLGGALAFSLLFYAAIRLKWNLRASDPSLTFPQMLVASMVNTYLVYHTTEVRGVLLMGYVLILVFGIFKLRRPQFLVVGALVLIVYACIIAVEYVSNRPGFNLPVEVFQWLVLSFVYPWFAWVGGYISDLRRKQRETNQQLKVAIEHNAKTLELIRKQAICDELTGLFNRRHMLEQLAGFNSAASAGRDKFCVLLIDIDHFKRINDSAGHFVGDQVLVECAAAIQTSVRKTDTVARWGGEEFMVLLPSESLSSIGDVIDRIHHRITALDFSGLGVNAPVTVSIGAAESRREELVKDVLTAADTALYLAKANGRNRTEFRQVC